MKNREGMLRRVHTTLAALAGLLTVWVGICLADDSTVPWPPPTPYPISNTLCDIEAGYFCNDWSCTGAGQAYICPNDFVSCSYMKLQDVRQYGTRCPLSAGGPGCILTWYAVCAKLLFTDSSCADSHCWLWTYISNGCYPPPL
jgi:hypothetical protein